VQSVKVESRPDCHFGGLWLAFPAKPWLMAKRKAWQRSGSDRRRAKRQSEIVVLVFRDSNGFTNDGSKAVRTERVRSTRKR